MMTGKNATAFHLGRFPHKDSTVFLRSLQTNREGRKRKGRNEGKEKIDKKREQRVKERRKKKKKQPLSNKEGIKSL